MPLVSLGVTQCRYQMMHLEEWNLFYLANEQVGIYFFYHLYTQRLCKHKSSCITFKLLSHWVKSRMHCVTQLT